MTLDTLHMGPCFIRPINWPCMFPAVIEGIGGTDVRLGSSWRVIHHPRDSCSNLQRWPSLEYQLLDHNL